PGRGDVVETAPPAEIDVVAARVPALAGLEHDERPDRPTGDLLDVVQMGVIDEGAGSGQREVGGEAVGRKDRRSSVGSLTGPTHDSVGPALEVDAVPMNADGLPGPVVHRDVGRFAPIEHDE